MSRALGGQPGQTEIDTQRSNTNSARTGLGEHAHTAPTVPLSMVGEDARFGSAGGPAQSSRLAQTRGRRLKRSFDVGASILALPLALPLMLLISILIKVTSRGPVFFRQERIGRGGAMFRVLKFRTMHVDAVERLQSDPVLYQEYISNDFKLPNHFDPRIVRFGRVLRRSSLDELPQLFNVLGGTMSLVGPRPVVVAELECYGPLAWAYLEVRPGITGRWQTDGRNTIKYPERADLDAGYLLNWRFRDDVVILLKTVPSVIRRRGSH